jgi:hypothetical protein
LIESTYRRWTVEIKDYVEIVVATVLIFGLPSLGLVFVLLRWRPE